MKLEYMTESNRYIYNLGEKNGNGIDLYTILKEPFTEETILENNLLKVPLESILGHIHEGVREV